MGWIKKSLIALLSLLILSGIGGYFYVRIKFQPPPNQIHTAPGEHKVPLTWQADNTNAYAALLIPVQLPGCDHNFFMQLDTGAPYSVFYKSKLMTIRERCEISIHEEAGELQKFTFNIAGLGVEANTIKMTEHGSGKINWQDSTINIIGTAGTDLLENKIVVIDYQKQLMLIADSMPAYFQNAPLAFGKLDFEGRRIMLPASINGNETTLMFDTGSSAFALLTSKSQWDELRIPKGNVQSFPVNSWSKTLTAHRANSMAKVELAEAAIPLGSVTYIEGMSSFQQLLMSFSGMGGMIGNKLLIDHTIILDLQSDKFAVL